MLCCIVIIQAGREREGRDKDRDRERGERGGGGGNSTNTGRVESRPVQVDHVCIDMNQILHASFRSSADPSHCMAKVTSYKPFKKTLF